MRSMAISAVMLFLLGGCSVTRWGNTQEGANDYRIFIPPDDPATKPSDCHVSDTDWKDTTRTFDASRIAYSLGCYSRFQRQPPAKGGAESDKTFFQPKEKITIYLKTASFHYFSESDFEVLSNEAVNLVASSKVKGEIAILANVTQKSRDPGSLGPDGQLQGKVVYYGNDIYHGQLADEFNIPIYGPEEWSGGPLTLDLWILELDQAQSQQLGSILKTLSSLAGKFTGLTAGGGEVLNQVGTAFLNSNRDDVAGHIAITLVPPSPGEKTADPLLRVSDIIVHRNDEKEPRSKGVAFDDCYYEPLQAKVYCQKGNDGEVPKRSAMVLAIRRAIGTTPLVSDIGLAQLNERLGKASNMREVSEIIQSGSDEAVAKASAQEAREDIARIASPSTPGAVRTFDAERVITLLQCALIAQRKGPRVADSAAITAAEQAFDSYCGPRSMRSAIDMDDFNVLGRKIIELLTVDTGDLDFAKLIGSDPYPVASLRALRDALILKFVPRP